MAEDRKNSWKLGKGQLLVFNWLHPRMEISLKFRLSKGNSFYITDDTLTKLHLHNHTMVIYI